MGLLNVTSLSCPRRKRLGYAKVNHIWSQQIAGDAIEITMTLVI